MPFSVFHLVLYVLFAFVVLGLVSSVLSQEIGQVHCEIIGLQEDR